MAGETPGAEVFDASHEVAISRLPLKFTNWGFWDFRGGPQYLRVLWRLAPILARTRPRAIHCGKCLPEGLVALMLKPFTGTPYRCYVHGEEMTLAATSRQLRRLNDRVLNHAECVIANSYHTEQMLRRDWGVPADRIVVLHPGVDASKFVPAPEDATVREQLGWTGRRVILTVGALQKRKGQDMLIRALPAIRARCPNVLYSMVGEGWERPYLDRLVSDEGVRDLVQFRGIPSDEELVSCYQQCDVFALPNRQVGWDFEGFGIVLLEAQACGKPVIAGMSGGTPETLSPGETGELVNCDTPEMLGQVIADMLENTAKATVMGERARQWIVERFDWSSLSAQALTLFTS